MGAPDRIHTSGRPYSTKTHWPLPHVSVCITEHIVKGMKAPQPSHPCGTQRAGKRTVGYTSVLPPASSCSETGGRAVLQARSQNQRAERLRT